MMDSQQIPFEKRIFAEFITRVVAGLLAVGWLCLRSPQPPSEKGAQNTGSQETATAHEQQTPASAGREDGAASAQSAAVAANTVAVIAPELASDASQAGSQRRMQRFALSKISGALARLS